MSSKIRVDPKTFKIINQKQEKESLPSDSETMTSLTSDSSSGSDSESVRVIKLDGGNPQQQPSQQQQPQQQQPQQQQNKPPQPPQPPQQQQNKPPQPPQPPQQSKPLQQPQTQTSTSIEKYLKSESLSNEELDNDSNEESNEESFEESKEESSEESIVNNNIQAVEEPDVIDLSQSKLYDILHSIFTDSNGISVSENIEKMSKLFDKHNQIMEKILNQLIIMNSNNKQITIPEAVQTNTKIANNDFRSHPEKKENKN